jgi:hypothetical protein
MSGDRKFDLGDYVEVKDRIRIFYELYAQGRLVTEEVQLTNEPDGVPRVLVRAAAYRSSEDEHPARGWSWMELPGKTTYTRGSELENTETSAWGRAIAALGILVDKSIASAQEVQNKSGGEAPEKARHSPTGVHDPLALTGIIEEAKDSPDFLPHVDPVEGYVLTFKLREDGRRGGIKVVATGLVAEQLADVGKDALGMRVSCWGKVKDESFTNKAKREITYQVLELQRISGPFGILPVSPLRDPEDEVLAAIPVADGQVAAWDQAESDRLDREAAAAS